MEGNLTPATETTAEHSRVASESHEPESSTQDCGQPATAPPPDDPDVQAACGSEATSSALTPEEEAELRRIKDLPKEVGVMLMTVGVLGFVLPGVVGTPAAIAGGLVLWPKTFGKIENWFERKFPETHKHSLYQIHRYLDDLESRYPNLTGDK
jgi:hypothetical protein